MESVRSQSPLDDEISFLRERLESAEEMRRAIVAEEVDGFVVGEEQGSQRVVLLETSKLASPSLLERLPHCVVTVSHSGKILYANQRFGALVGWPLPQLFSSPITELIAAGDREALKRFLTAGVPDSTLLLGIRHADGRMLPSRVTAVALGNGYTTMVVDAEAADRNDDAERALQAIHEGSIDGVVVGGEHVMLVADASNPYRVLADRMQQGAATVSQHGDVLYANEPFAAMVMASREALLGNPLHALVGAEIAEHVLARRGDLPSSGEFHLTRRDGTTLRVRVNAQQVDGVDALMLIFSDLTDHDRLEEVQERARRNDQFLAVLAHELRNPLGAIWNAVAILGRTDAVNERSRGVVEIIKRQSETLMRLVDDLLDVRRLNDGTIVLRRAPVDLRSTIDNVVRATHASIAQKKQCIEVVPSADPLYVDADEVRIGQVFGNLIVNASKFTPQGGRIDVIVRKDRIDDVQPMACVEIVDNGIGIPSDMIDRIFEPFVQAEREHAASSTGLGLGLAIARRLVQLHGGSIAARSDGPGHGSRFIVRFPLYNAPAAVETAHPVDGRVPTMRILVVDDDRDSATSLSALLQLAGHETLVANRGDQAIELAQQSRPHVAILDLGMPGMDGYAVARTLRAQPWGEALVLYALSGWGQSEDRLRTRDSGFDAHFVKPVDLDELMRHLGAHPKLQTVGDRRLS